jgi:CopG-like RHH_1 or ribbon-helix-helix domain, RHH_5
VDKNTDSEKPVAKPRVTVSLPQDVYDYLVERADNEIRPVSNLVEFLVVTTVRSQRDFEKRDAKTDSSEEE